MINEEDGCVNSDDDNCCCMKLENKLKKEGDELLFNSSFIDC